MNNLSNILSFVIPVRIDSQERLRNITAVTSWLEQTQCAIYILEADATQQIPQELCNRVSINYTFVKDENPCFHRTKYINELLNKSKTVLSAIWDVDIVLPIENITSAVFQNIEYGETITYPYARKCIWLSASESDDFCNSKELSTIENTKSSPIIGRPFCGGAFIVNTEQYLSIGGENEKFTGWGPEDAERMRRCRILGHKANWIDIGLAYHLAHPIKDNSRYFNQEMADTMRREFVMECCMTEKELYEHICINSSKVYNHWNICGMHTQKENKSNGRSTTPLGAEKLQRKKQCLLFNNLYR